MSIREDLSNQTFGQLTVTSFSHSSNGKSYWLCQCSCGNPCTVLASNLKKGHTKSCGCIKSSDITGKKYGKLTVLGRSDKRSTRGSRTTPLWECLCECGTITYKAKDTLTNPNESMCASCAEKYAIEQARKSAGFVDGTQITKLKDMTPNASNTSGCRGVYFERKTNKWRARLKFKGKIMSFGTYDSFDDAVKARKQAELEYFGTFLEEKGETF